MVKVDFFIVGEPKSGTTALASFLDEHPEICLSNPKEPGFMARDHQAESDKFHGKKKFFFTRTPQQYDKLFVHAKPGQILGEASTNYLYSKAASQEIYNHNPKAKIIMLLRNPVDMIYSLYHQYVNETKEDAESFSRALALEKDRKNWKKLSGRSVTPSFYFYRDWGMYYEQVKRYFDVFDKDQIMVLPAESFKADNAKLYKQVLEFLGVRDTSFLPEFKSVNESRAPKSSALNRLLRAYAIKRTLLSILGRQRYTALQKKIIEPLMFRSISRSKLDPALRRELEEYFKEDVAKLSDFLGTDFRSIWKI